MIPTENKMALAADEGNSLRSFIAGQKFKDQVALALPSHMTPDRFARVALTALTKTPKLLDCTRESLLGCLMSCSQFGIEPDGRHAHLIPYGKDCTLIIDWKGLVALAKRSGQVKLWRAEIVKEHDEFTWDTGQVSHRVNWRADRGKTDCVYSHVVMSDGTADYEVMTLAEVEAIRKRSRAGQSGPWVTDFDEMAKKTVMRRHSKRLTLSPEFFEALSHDADRFDEIRNARVATTPAPPVPKFSLEPPAAELEVVNEPAPTPAKKAKKPSAAKDFWAWVESKGFDAGKVTQFLIDNNHIADRDDELSDEEAAKVDRNELDACMF